MKRILFTILCAFTGTVQSASFDCSVAQSKIEKLICSDEKISILDEQLGMQYQRAKNRLGEADAKFLKQNQQLWLSDFQRSCNDIECLNSVYQIRIGALEAIADSVESFQVPKDTERAWQLYARREPDANFRLNSFNRARHIDSSGGYIKFCHMLTSLHVGTVSGNSSFGGVCEYSNSGVIKTVLVCDDNMVGHYRIESITSVPSLYDLAVFTHSNCTGG